MPSFSWSPIKGGGGGGVSSIDGLTGALTLVAGQGISISAGGSAITIAGVTATASVAGIVTTGSQTFAGAKTFNGAVSTPELTLVGATSGTVSIKATAASSTYVLNLPAAQGAVDTFLKNDGSGNLSWAAGTGASGVTAIGTLDSQSPSLNGLVISGTTLFAQTASASYPGMVSTGAQTFGGNKTFNDDMLVAGTSYLSDLVTSLPASLDSATVQNDLAVIGTTTLNTSLTGVLVGASGVVSSQSYATLTGNLSNMVGDSGSGGAKGLVPAPSTGDASKFLKGDGTWAALPSSGDVTGPASSTDNALARFDLTTGKIIQNSVATLSDAGVLSGLTGLTTSGTTTLSSGLSGVVKASSGVLSASSIVNADVSASAALALSKLATVTASRVLVSNASGAISASSVTSTTLGYLDATSSIQTQLNAKSPTLNDTGSGETLIASASTGKIKKIIAGSNVTVTPSADGVTIAATGGGSGAYIPSVVTRITATGSSTYNLPYAFAASSSVTTVVGDTYTHNSVTYTVVVSAVGSIPILSGSSAPLSSGTLTRSSGTGAASITFTSFMAPIELENTIVGGGGGGGAGTGGSSGSNAGSSTMNGVTAAGGYGGQSSAGLAGNGGAVSGNVAGLTEVAIEGNDGATASTAAGGIGGIGYFGGLGRPGRAGIGDYGEHGAANSGAGGAGGATTSGDYGGGGGGGGGVYKGVIRNPAATYAVTVGTGGAGGAGGGSGTTGTNGGSGVVIIKAKWQ